ncbi:hypothetical protein A0H81_03804 [Grifola frondosa]|uniref:Uncharacterized protein n=1 Tax=Grifola frondosa TaxID=5627 RepID=A0A1C7MK55_GRIFR|nr:hypothetical protein A0H81_03804 [Grifola frondosa]
MSSFAEWSQLAARRLKVEAEVIWGDKAVAEEEEHDEGEHKREQSGYWVTDWNCKSYRENWGR